MYSFHRFIHLNGKLLHTVKERVWKDAHLSLGRAGLHPLQGVVTAGWGAPGGEGGAPAASHLGLRSPRKLLENSGLGEFPGVTDTWREGGSAR